MEVVQIWGIVFGALFIGFSVIQYIFHPTSRLFISRRLYLYLEESKRIKFQKVTALPSIVLGIVFIVVSVFFWNHQYIYPFGMIGAWCTWIVWMMVLNKMYLGYFFAGSVPR
jgi:hypothetical protein